MVNDNDWHQEPIGEGPTDEQPTRQIPGPVQKKKLSTAVKVLLLLSGLGGCTLLCCCGGFVYLGVQVNNSRTFDPAAIQSIADGIARLEIPPGFEPDQGMDWQKAGLPRLIPIHQFAVFGWEGDVDRGQLVLLQVRQALPLASEAELLEAFEAQNPEVSLPGLLPLRAVSERSTREYHLDGRPVTVLFTTGMDQLSQQTREARLTVADPDLRTVRRIILRRRQSEFDEETVHDLLRSIKLP